jgi:sulfite exporter TauE/SafE
MTALIVAVFAASVLGSLHCVGMCGAFLALSLTPDERGSRTPRWMLALAYHVGRLVTYLVMGTIGGLIGAAVNITAEAAGLQRAAAALAGAMMVVFGTLALARHLGPRLAASNVAMVRALGRWSGLDRVARAATGRMPVPKAMETLAIAGHRRAAMMPPVARAMAIGLLTTLLPCGWLYAFAITAAGTGHPAKAALVMAVFWVGTLPVMVGLGMLVTSATGVLRRHIPLATSLLVVAFGIATLLGREVVPAFATAAPVSFASDADAAAHVATLRTRPLPCCNPMNSGAAAADETEAHP